MSTGSLAQRVAQLEADASALEEALKKSKSTGRLLFLAFVVLVAVVLTQGYLMVAQIQDATWQAEMVAKLRQSYSGNSKQYNQEFQKLWKSVNPKLKQAFEEQLKEDSPRFRAAFVTQRDLFAKNIRGKLEGALEDHWEDALNKHEAILREEFPEIQDRKKSARIIANVDLAIQKLVQKYYIGEFEKQFTDLYAIYDDFGYADAPDSKTGEKGLPTQFVGQLLELMKLKLISAPDVAGAP